MTINVLFFGTHPQQFNGYSKVVYELVKCNDVFKNQNIKFSVYGFQKFYDNPLHRRDLPQDVDVYNAFEHENPKNQGFGFTEVRKYVNEVKPDVCIIYNDMMVQHNVITQIKEAQKEDGLKCKIIGYIDQVYLHQKKEFIDFANTTMDHAILFTSYWEKNIVDQGLTIPTSYLPHGINPNTYFPVPQKLARKFFNVPEDAFIVMNLNRNQPRKRWDTCLKAFAELVSRHRNSNIKLLIATSVNGAWNLMEIYERELKKRSIALEEGMKHIVLMDNPQMLTDEQTNILYNVADVGINTCDGEGFGLCNFEQAAIGIPQIVPNIGGFLEFFDDNSACLIEPIMNYYVDSTRDSVCGEAQLCDYGDFTQALEDLYLNKQLRDNISKQGRRHIVTNYPWKDIALKLSEIVNKVIDKREIEVFGSDIEIEDEIKIKIKEKRKLEIEELKRKLAELMKEDSI